MHFTLQKTEALCSSAMSLTNHTLTIFIYCHDAGRMMSLRTKTVIVTALLILILTLALFLRLYHLDQESLWSDEAFTVHHASVQDWDEFIRFISTTEAAPPGHYLFLHYWINWFGDSEFSVRFPSVIFGVLSIVLLFLILQRLWEEKPWGRRAALLASLFMATSMLQVLFSQEARLYSLFTLLTLAAVYFFVRMLSEKEKLSTKENNGSVQFWYYLLIAAAFYVNYLAAAVMALFTLVIISKVRKKEISLSFLRRWLWWHAVVVLAVLLLVWPVLHSQFSILNTGLREILMGKGLPSLFASMGLFFYALPAVLFILGAAVLLWLEKPFTRLLQHRSFDVLFSFIVFAAGSAYLYLSFFPLTMMDIAITRFPITHSYFLLRHAFFLVPLWYVFLAWKLSTLRWRKVALIMAILVLAVSGTALYEYYSQTTKVEWRDAMSFIAEESADAPAGNIPLILLDHGGFSNTFLLPYYYPGQERLVLLTSSSGPRKPYQELSDEEALQSVQDEEEFWLVLAGNSKTGYYYRDVLDGHYTRTVHRQFKGVEVYGYGK